MGAVIPAKDVFVLPESISFWWSDREWQPCYWEDFSITFRNQYGLRERHATSVITKGYIRCLLENEKKYSDPHAKEEAADECKGAEKTIEEVLNSKDIFFRYYYDEPSDEAYQVSFEAPRNALGWKPRFIDMIHPAETLSTQVLEECTMKYVREFLKIPFAHIQIVSKPKSSYLQKEFLREQSENERRRKFIESGGKFKVQAATEFLEQFYGTAELEKIGGRENVVKGILREGRFFAVLKDGAEVPLGNPDVHITRDKE